MEQLERIIKMSTILKEAKEACEELDLAMERLGEALEKYEGQRDNILILSEYYESREWMKDFEDDEAGLIPDGIDKGALSEDGIYDLLMDQKNVEDILGQLKTYLSEE